MPQKKREKVYSNAEKVILQSNMKTFLLIFAGLFVLCIIIHAAGAPDWLKQASVFLPLAYGIILSMAIFIKNSRSEQ